MSEQGGDGFRQLRLWTGIVLLGLLVAVTFAGILNPSFHAEPAFYYLVAGMVSGLFGAEVVRLVTNRNNKDDR